MNSWLNRHQNSGIVSAPATAWPYNSGYPFPTPTTSQSYKPKIRDPNAPDRRLEVEDRCVYERNLPGDAYVTAHVQRLQSGFYDSPSTHGDCIENVRFLAINFVFHPSKTGHRFKSAAISVAIHDDTDQTYSDPAPPLKRRTPSQPKQKPKILRFAPHILYGAISPETLDWNFNLAGSVGVSQGPANASISPSGGVKSSYKVYEMMRIQGSARTLRSWFHKEYDIEDGEVIWTLEENKLQKSGLPREFTFVMLITKGDVENVVFDVEVEPVIASWYGHFPKLWVNSPRYKPLQKETMDLDKELGQRFDPCVPKKGFNFANLATTFDDFVILPGTTYSTSDQTPSAGAPQQTGSDSQQKPKDSDPKAKGNGDKGDKSNNDVNLHVFLHGYPTSGSSHMPGTPNSRMSPAPDSRRHSSIAPLPMPLALPSRAHSQNHQQNHRSIDIAYSKPRPDSGTYSATGASNGNGTGGRTGNGSRRVSGSGSLRRSRSRTDLRDDQSRHSSASVPQSQSQSQTQSQPQQAQQQSYQSVSQPRQQRLLQNLDTSNMKQQHRYSLPLVMPTHEEVHSANGSH